MTARQVEARPEGASGRQLLVYGLGLVAAGLCLVWSFQDVDFAQVWRVVERLGPMVAWGLVPYGLSVLFDGLGLRSLLAALGRGAGALRLAGIRLSAEALTLSLPAGPVLAEGVRLMLLQTRCQVDVPQGVGALGARKCLILRGHGLFLLLATLVGWGFLHQRSAALLGLPGLPLLLGGVGVSLLLVSAGMGRALSGGSTVTRLSLLLERLPFRAVRAWLERRRTAIARTDSHLGQALEGRGSRHATLFYLLIWLAESFEGYLLLRLLGVEMSLGQALAMEAIVSVARSLAFVVPAGLGIQDASYVALLHTGGGSASLELAATFALLKRMRELAWAGVGLALLLHGRARRGRMSA
ncbi:lysylphosphatidylglycerol synthase transmembrane domain-containing protein [Hyalangium versicolor]|uniref:lysylphosphatidylglycerol synthase transmembrane domain-containing protein n=1 Tax=Hyalangium versicolor TaxID=2861190 RepID=UPI001CC984D4|nr:lysylphosphatidylglycerol synthase transmembrane domain-containing protein [Hyalangium versicolor]